MSHSRSAASTRALPASVISTSGRRRVGPQRPSRDRANFAGAGLGSQNSVRCRGSKPQVDLRGATRVARDRRGAQLVHRARGDVGSDADIAVAAEQHQRDRGAVVARVDRELFRRGAQQPARSLDAAGGLLDADDAGHLRQPQHGVVLQVGHGPAGDVVQHHRDVDHLGDLREVAVHAFLRRLVVVRHDLQRACGADPLRVPGQLDRLERRVAPRARHDRHAAGRAFHADADDLDVLFDVHRRRLAGRAHRHDAVGALGGVPVDQRAQRRVVDAAVLVHRGDQRHDAADDSFHSHSLGELCSLARGARALATRRSRPWAPPAAVVLTGDKPSILARRGQPIDVAGR